MSEEDKPLFIKLEVGRNRDSWEAKAEGSASRPLHEDDLRLFGLSKSVISDYLVGKNRGPQGSDENDNDIDAKVFDLSGFGDARVICKPADGKPTIGNFVPDTLTRDQGYITNKSDQIVTKTVTVARTHSNTCTTSWSTTYTTSAEQFVNVGVEVNGVGAQGGEAWTFEEQFGVNNERSDQVTLSSEHSISVPVAPGKNVKVLQQVAINRMSVRIPFELTLEGTHTTQVAIYEGFIKDSFKKRFQKDYWSDRPVDVNKILDYAGLEKNRTTDMVLNIGLSSHSSVEVVQV